MRLCRFTGLVIGPQAASLSAVDSDEQLMQQYQRGQSAAFETLYQRYRGDLYRFLLRQFEQTQAEELYQEIWMKVIQGQQRYQPQASFRTWLYTIAHNHLRDQARRQQVRIETQPEAAAPEPQHQLDPVKVSQDQQAWQALLQGIQQLPGEQRQAFLLQVEAGLSLTEIAEVMNSNTESSKSRLRYAMRKLREHLKGLWP